MDKIRVLARVMSLSWGVSNNRQLDIERATQNWKDTVVGIEEEIKVIFEVDRAGEIDHIFQIPIQFMPFVFNLVG